MAVWVKLFFLTYSTTRIGLLFNAWPDGRAAEDQPQLLLDVFGVMRDEAVQIMNEEAPKQ